MRFYYLGEFDSNGKSNRVNVGKDGQIFDSTVPSYVNRINGLLPERKKMHHEHLEWLAENSFDFVDNTELSVTFVDEGAGYRNSIAYFICDTNNKPKTIAHISECYFIFPNCSKVGSGGSLNAGDTVLLPYQFNRYSASGKDHIVPTNYVFPEGKTIGFILYPNAWIGTGVTPYVVPFSSSFYHNPEKAEELKHHTVCLKVPETDRLLLGFEDINRESNGCDHDFNDAIFLVNVNLTSIGKGFTDTKGFSKNGEEPNIPDEYTIGYKKIFTRINNLTAEAVVTLFIPKESDIRKTLHASNKKRTNRAYVKEIIVVNKTTNLSNTSSFVSRRVDSGYSWYDHSFIYTKKSFVETTLTDGLMDGISYFDSFKEAADYAYDPYKL